MPTLNFYSAITFQDNLMFDNLVYLLWDYSISKFEIEIKHI